MSGTKTSPSPCSRGTYSLKVISIPHFDYLHAGCSEKKQSAMKLLNAEAIGPFKTVTQWNAPLCSLWLRLRAPATDELIATGILLEAWVFCKNSPRSEGVFPEEVGKCVQNNDCLPKIHSNLRTRLRSMVTKRFGNFALFLASHLWPAPPSTPWHKRCLNLRCS